MIWVRVVLAGVMMRSRCVSRDFRALGKITTGKKVEKLDCLIRSQTDHAKRYHLRAFGRRRLTPWLVSMRRRNVPA